MNSMIKLGGAIVLAVAAGIGNYYWMWTVENQHTHFLRISSAVDEGDRLQAKMIDSVAIPGDVAELRKTFVPASRETRALMIGMRAPRDMNVGDLVLQQDMQTDVPHWKPLGPFRLVSVGDRIAGTGGFSEGNTGRAVTIAAKVDERGRYEPKVERLLDIINANSDSAGPRIVAVQLEPSGDTGAALTGSLFPGDTEIGAERQTLALAPNERGIIVPLQGVESVPELLVLGSHISFVVSWYDDTLERMRVEDGS